MEFYSKKIILITSVVKENDLKKLSISALLQKKS